MRDAPDAAAVRPAVAAVDPAADRAAISAFLAQEREFLQSLAGLVQGHAESVKGMARDARDAAPRPPPRRRRPPPGRPHRPSPRRRPAPRRPPHRPSRSRNRSRAEPERAEPELAAPPSRRAAAADAAEEPIRVDAPSREPEAEPPTVPASTDRPTEAMEEPVRVDEPEPATVGRAGAGRRARRGGRPLAAGAVLGRGVTAAPGRPARGRSGPADLHPDRRRPRPRPSARPRRPSPASSTASVSPAIVAACSREGLERRRPWSRPEHDPVAHVQSRRLARVLDDAHQLARDALAAELGGELEVERDGEAAVARDAPALQHLLRRSTSSGSSGIGPDGVVDGDRPPARERAGERRRRRATAPRRPPARAGPGAGRAP